MISKRIENIIVKYLTNQATYFELDELESWVQKPENEKLFYSFVRTNYAIEYNLREFNSYKVKKILSDAISNERRVIKLNKIRQVIRYAAAAVVIGIFTTTYLFRDNLFNTSIDNTPVIVNTNSIEPGTDKATLTLDDGSVVTLEKGNNYQTQTAISNGEEIIYEPAERSSAEIAYNYLTIPRGGQFHVVLTDGTEVWLNSESQLKYPVAFIDGETRQVELVYGEAYFDVSPSTKHKGSKFKVFNQSQEIEVLGTEFNIKAYKDETNIYTTLVEGKVAVNFENRIQNLLPSEQSNYNPITKDLVITEVDVYNEISWKDGVFSFERKPLKEIMNVLSRWYDMDVVFENESLENVKFFGVLDKEQDIKEILKTIKKFKIIESYEIKDKVIVLK